MPRSRAAILKGPAVCLLLIAVLCGVAAYVVSQRGNPVSYRITAHSAWEAPLVNGRRNSPPGSPRVADLNGDGVLDVVIGGGDEDRTGYLTAIDGSNGEQLWIRHVADEVTPASPLLDINNDGTLDAFVNGRKAIENPFAVDGRTGKTIWNLQDANPDAYFEQINFLHAYVIVDQDRDNVTDLLLIQSGGDDDRRIPATYFVVSAASGKILREHRLPDRRESYALPILHQEPDGASVLFAGSGGETLPGQLYKLDFSTMKKIWHVSSQAVAGDSAGSSETGKGFVASPLLTDLESDGVLEVIAAGMNGYLYRIDAVSGTVGWSEGDPAFEAYASPAVGQFDEDSTLDVVAVFNKGAFPNYTHSEIVWRNGATGRVIHEKNFAPDFRYSAASPLVVDFDGDGRDEVIVVLSNNYAKGNTNRLVVFDGGDDKAVAFSRTFKGFSGATPCLTDVDANGKLDLIHAHDSACLRFELTVEAETPAGRRELKPLVRWGEYRGPNGSGVFLPASSGGRTQP